MATTLPQFTKAIDNAFVQTWYEVRPEAIDNILNATPVWAALRAMGCFTTQVGGTNIERTVKYDTGDALAVDKGDVLGMGEKETQTAAFWRWRYLSSHMQRSLIDDQRNNGKFRIKSYISQRIEEAREAMTQEYETDIMRTETTDESGKFIQSINDIVPAFANRATGTYGGIARSNTWWQPKYLQWTAPIAANMLANMRTAYNNAFNNQTAPKLIITDQTLYETYEDWAEDKMQIIKDTAGVLIDLGFEVLRYKGKPFVWTPNITANNMIMLNTDFVELVYDPTAWFEMTEWKPVAQQFERLAHILSACNLISTQLRRHVRLYP